MQKIANLFTKFGKILNFIHWLRKNQKFWQIIVKIKKIEFREYVMKRRKFLSVSKELKISFIARGKLEFRLYIAEKSQTSLTR